MGITIFIKCFYKMFNKLKSCWNDMIILSWLSNDVFVAKVR